MKIKKILIYLIFAFVMLLPFSVNALEYSHYGEFSSSGEFITLSNMIEQLSGYSENSNYIITHIPEDHNYYYVFIGESLSYYVTDYKEDNLSFTLSSSDYIYGYKIHKKTYNKIALTDYYTKERIPNTSSYRYVILNGYKYFNPYSYRAAGEQVIFERNSNGFYLNFKGALEKNGINIKDSGTFPVGFKLEFSHFYSKKSISLSGDSPFTEDGITSLIFPVQVFESSLPSNRQMTILNYRGDSNSSVELSYKINEEAYKDSCFSVLGLSWACDTYVTDFLQLDITSNESFKFYIYVSNDGKNWSLTSNAFSGTTVNSPFTYSTNYLSRISGNNTLYVKYVFSLTNTQIMNIFSTYSKDYIKMTYTPITYASNHYTSYDMTGKYAIGLIPKSSYSMLNGTFKYLGDFTTYAKSDSSEGVYSYATLSSSTLKSYGISFGSLYSTESPIFYIINNNYGSNITSTIEYLDDLFYIVEFEDEFAVANEPNTNKNYPGPSKNVNVVDNSDDDNNSSSGIDLSLTSLFNKLPELIGGLGNAFVAIGQCVTIAFTSLPEVVQAVLYLSLVITIILVAIKLIK